MFDIVDINFGVISSHVYNEIKEGLMATINNVDGGKLGKECNYLYVNFEQCARIDIDWGDLVAVDISILNKIIAFYIDNVEADKYLREKHHINIVEIGVPIYKIFCSSKELFQKMVLENFGWFINYKKLDSEKWIEGIKGKNKECVDLLSDFADLLIKYDRVSVANYLGEWLTESFDNADQEVLELSIFDFIVSVKVGEKYCSLYH